jgi:hypothetical protein
VSRFFAADQSNCKSFELALMRATWKFDVSERAGHCTAQLAKQSWRAIVIAPRDWSSISSLWALEKMCSPWKLHLVTILWTPFSLFGLHSDFLLCVHFFAECNRAITDIRVISAADELPDGYEVLYSTMFGADARLNRGVWSMGGDKTYLCISRDAPGPPITDLILIFGDEGELCPAGYMKINHNLNMGQRGHDVYLCFTKDAKNPPLIDLQLIAPSENESFPSGYFKVSRSLHEGAYGTSLYVCYKKSPTSKLDLSYKSVILDHYPKYDRPDSPLPQPVALVRLFVFHLVSFLFQSVYSIFRVLVAVLSTARRQDSL